MTQSLLFLIVELGRLFFMSTLCKRFFNNAKNPSGILGKYILTFMNGYGHKDLAEWAIELIGIIDGESILDIGCGGGGNISRFLQRFPNSLVNGIDYSQIAVKLSKKNNAKAIAEERCKISLGEAQCLPFDSESFDVITAFETVYYWKNIEQSFREVLRVLKPKGKFSIINGADAEGGWTWDAYIDGMRTYKPFELEQILKQSGFDNIQILRKRDCHFVCIIAYKNN